jgi:hypothetical protein
MAVKFVRQPYNAFMARETLQRFATMGGRAVSLLLLGVPGFSQTQPDQVLLKDYHPQSIYKIPQTRVERARYPAIDMHSHNYARAQTNVDVWVRTMDEVGLEKTIILSGRPEPTWMRRWQSMGSFRAGSRCGVGLIIPA